MREITNTCGPKCIYFSCNSDVDDLNKRCTCDKYDIFVHPEDLCKDYDDHYTPVHDDFPVFEINEKYYTPKTETELTNFAAKHDEGKPKLSLVPMKIIFAIEKIRAYGNAKYPDGGINNWKTVESKRHFEAMLRHAAKCWNNPYAIDPESELPHMFHMACDMAFFIEQNWDDFETAIDVHKFNVEYEEKRMKNESGKSKEE